MENPDILEKILMYTGLAGLVVFGVFSLFKGIIQKNIFSSMTKAQSYSVIKLVIRGSLTLAIIGIIAWGYIEIKKDEAYKSKALVSKKIKGKIVTLEGKPIQNAKITLKKDENSFHYSDVSGDFLLEVSGTGSKSFDLVVTHPNYQNITKLAEVNFASTESNVNVGELPLRLVREVEIPNNPNPIEPNDGKEGSNGKKANFDTYDDNDGFVDINLLYNDFGTGCNIQVQINIGGKIYTPNSNPVELLDVAEGYQQYTISGIGACGINQCQITGSGEIHVKEGAQYYILFDPTLTCVAMIFTQKEYTTFLQNL